MTGTISVVSKYIAPTEATMPGLGVHITRLAGSYMIWVGVTAETAETVDRAPLSGSLCRDWAYAMPPLPGSAVAGPATTLARTAHSDVALSMAQRLAMRVGGPVFLSVDVADTRLVVAAERGIVAALM